MAGVPVTLRRVQIVFLNSDFGYAGWHVWLSDQGRVWATSTRRRVAAGWRGGETVDADTPGEMRRLLAARDPGPATLELDRLGRQADHYKRQLRSAIGLAVEAHAALDGLDVRIALARISAACDLLDQTGART